MVRKKERKKERGLSILPDDPEALAREYAVENEGDAASDNEDDEDDGD